ncbi:hypothetical protein ACFLVI_01430 [Chloroflexota bacterium]
MERFIIRAHFVRVAIVVALVLTYCFLPQVALAKGPSDTYTVERYYAEAYTSSTGTNATTTFEDAVTLTFRPSADKDFLIIASALTQNLDSLAPTETLSIYYTEVQLDIGGTDYFTTHHGASDIVDNWRGFGAHHILSATGGVQYTVKVEFRSENTSGTAQIKWATIAALEVSNYFTEWAAGPLTTNATSANVDDQVLLSFAAAADDYLILSSATITHQDSGGETEFHVIIDPDGSNPETDGPGVTEYKLATSGLITYSSSFASMEQATMTASPANRTVTFQYWSDHGGHVAEVNDIRLTAVLLSDLTSTHSYYAEPLTEMEAQITASTSYVDVTTTISFNPEPETYSSDYLVIVSGLGKNTASGKKFSAQLAINGTGYGEYMFLNPSRLVWRSFFMLRKVNLGADANTVKIQFATNDATKAAHITNANHIVIQLDTAESYATAPGGAAAAVLNTYTTHDNLIYTWAHGLKPGISTYRVVYYDASDDTGNGGKVVLNNNGLSSSAYGSLNSACNADQMGAVEGTWHAVVYDNVSAETYYDTAVTSTGYVTEDTFVVEHTAIPEIPTVIAGIGVVGMCFAIYYWMRKRKARYVKA